MLFKRFNEISTPHRLGRAWYSIPGFENYQIDKFGNVRRSINNPLKKWRKAPGSILKPSKHDNKDAYLVVRIKDIFGKSRVMKVHQLVAITFAGPRPSIKHCALHKDDNRYNNRHFNIYWGTKKQNAIDRSLNGHHGRAKLNFEDVLWVKELYHGDRWTYKELADLFQISSTSIAQVITNRTYQWV